MTELNDNISTLRMEYRSIFKESLKTIDSLLQDIKPESVNGDLLEEYPKNSDGYKWQKDALTLLTGDISKDIFRKLNEILAYRVKFKCVGCATCCKLACCEFSPDELKDKANKGDSFSTQFLSVFIPYKSKEEAKRIYPEYITLLEENEETDVYFYHCRKLKNDNRCSDYKNRPQICRDFPDNPLCILPKTCGYKAWKDEIEPITLTLHSMLEIVEFYKRNLENQIH